MKYCVRCVMPNTKPGVFLDERGLCNACRSQEMKREFDWVSRRKELETIVDEIKETNISSYDCLVPVSGGKDSWYQAWMMKEVFGMKVLGCVMAPHLPTTEGIHNLNKMVESVGIDIVKITLKPSVFKNLRKKTFLRQGEPNWPEHNIIQSGVTNVAQVYDIPLIVWGEDIAFEFGGIQTQESKADASDININDTIKDKTIDDFLDDDISRRDTFFYRYPELKLSDGKDIKSIYLGYYDSWEGRKHFELATSMGFKSRADGPLSGNYIDYDNIDEKLGEFNIYFKYIKFGFWRPTDQVCYDIWNDKLSREDAVKIVNQLQDEFPHEYFENFLNYHNISEQEFWETVEKFRNLDIWKKDRHGEWKLKVKLQ